MAWINGLCGDCGKSRKLHLFAGTNPKTGRTILMCPDGLIAPVLSDDLADLERLIAEHHRLAAGLEQRLRKSGRDLARTLAGKYRDRIKDLTARYDQDLTARYDQRVAVLKADHAAAIMGLQDRHADEIKRCAARYTRMLTAVQEEHGEEIVRLKMAHQLEIEKIDDAAPTPDDAAKLQADNKVLAQGIKDVNGLNKKLTKKKEALEEEAAGLKARVAELEARPAAGDGDQTAPPIEPPPEDFPDDAVCETCGKPAAVRLAIDGKDGSRRILFACDKQNHRVNAMKQGGAR